MTGTLGQLQEELDIIVVGYQDGWDEKSITLHCPLGALNESSLEDKLDFMQKCNTLKGRYVLVSPLGDEQELELKKIENIYFI